MKMSSVVQALAIACVVLLANGCASTPEPPNHPGDAAELLPGVLVDLDARTVSFEARVAIDAFHPDTPDVYLETIACSPDTREHESLLVTDITPSDLHAVLLAIGAEPNRGEGHQAQLAITFATGDIDNAAPTDWIVSATNAQRYNANGYRFIGSRFVDDQGELRYDANGTGVIIGLADFPSAVIAPSETFSPSAAVAPPTWIADRDSIPPLGTPVVVTICRAANAVR